MDEYHFIKNLIFIHICKKGGNKLIENGWIIHRRDEMKKTSIRGIFTDCLECQEVNERKRALFFEGRDIDVDYWVIGG